jgi:hypothetical protein
MPTKLVNASFDDVMIKSGDFHVLLKPGQSRRVWGLRGSGIFERDYTRGKSGDCYRIRVENMNSRRLVVGQGAWTEQYRENI